MEPEDVKYGHMNYAKIPALCRMAEGLGFGVCGVDFKEEVGYSRGPSSPRLVLTLSYYERGSE